MGYSNQTKIIYEIKRSIINEFRYRYSNYDIGFLANFVEPDMSIDVDSLQEAFRIGLSDQDKLNLVEKYKNRVYDGYYRGEWFYGDIEYKSFTEEYLGHNLTDYKFHCSAGEPIFCQVIRDRNIGQINEVCVDMDGNCYDFHFDLNFALIKEFEKPKNWERMKEISKILCQDFDYVRVDMYNINIEDSTDESLFIGELTFAPMSGDYRGPGQVEAGKLLLGI